MGPREHSERTGPTVKSRLPSSTKARRSAAADVDAYLAALPADKRLALEKLRKAIRAAAPDAEDGFSYGLPAFRLHGRPLVAYAASTNHCSLYPMSPAVIRAHADDLRKYETSKGTVRFSVDKPLPPTLVRKLVRARMAQLRVSTK